MQFKDTFMIIAPQKKVEHRFQKISFNFKSLTLAGSLFIYNKKIGKDI